MISATDIFRAAILIAKGVEANAHHFKEMLNEAGYADVTYATDMQDVYDLHRKNRYSLIVIDLRFEGTYSTQLIQQLNAIESDGYTPVIASGENAADKELALKAGAKEFIFEPYNIEETLGQVRKMLHVRLLHEAACDAP